MFFSLLAGLLLAFAFQLLLTNLGVAFGLSALGWAFSPATDLSQQRQVASSKPLSARRPDVADSATDSSKLLEEPDEEAEGSAIPPVTHLLGLGVTLTLAPVLFATAFLTTTFSDILQLSAGLIFGLILWAAYLLILIWISSITVSGILDFVLGTATEGLRRLFLGVAQVFQDGADDKNKQTEDLQQAIEILSAEVQQTLAEQRELPVLLAQQRESLLKEIRDRTNLNQDQAESVLDSIESETAASETDSSEAAVATNITTGDISTEVSIDAEGKFDRLSTGPAAGLMQMLPNWREMLRMAVSQIDTDDLDIEMAWNTFQRFVGDDSASTFSIVSLDAENYLREVPAYALQAETLPEEFAERIYDPEANPSEVARQVEVLDESDFTHWLSERGDLTEDIVEQLTDKLTVVQADVLEHLEEKIKEVSNELEDTTENAIVVAPTPLTEVERESANEDIEALQKKLVSYFRYTTLSKLSAQSVEDKLKDLCEEIADFEERAGSWIEGGVAPDFEAIAQTISRRKGITQKQQNELTNALKAAWERNRIEPAAVPLSQKIADYLQSVDWSEANLEDLKDEVLQQIKAGVSSSGRFSESFDIGRLVTSLSVPETVKADLLLLMKTQGRPLLKRPRRWVERAADTSQDWGTRLSRQVGQYIAHQELSSPDMLSKSEQIVQEASRIVQSAAQSIPAEQIPHLGAEFWQQALAYRPDIDSVDASKAASRLAEIWQSTTQALPKLKDRVKEQSVAQFQEVQAIAQSLTHFVNEDVLEPVSEALPGLDKLLEPTKQKFVAALDLAQDSFHKQRALVAQDLQKKAERVRKQVAIAAWWLFVSLFTSGAAAAAGGWLAVWVQVKT